MLSRSDSRDEAAKRLSAVLPPAAVDALLADAEAEGVYIGQATERAKVPSTRLRKI